MTTDLILTGFGGVIVLLLTLAGFLFNRWMQDLGGSIKVLCETNAEEHEEIKGIIKAEDDKIWKRVNNHGHRIKTGNGGYETAEVLIKGES